MKQTICDVCRNPMFGGSYGIKGANGEDIILTLAGQFKHGFNADVCPACALAALQQVTP